jgi:hypothetical protein
VGKLLSTEGIPFGRGDTVNHPSSNDNDNINTHHVASGSLFVIHAQKKGQQENLIGNGGASFNSLAYDKP